MAIPDKNDLLGPTVTEAQFKGGFGSIVDFLQNVEGQSPAYATTEMLIASRPEANQSYAKALDTGTVWFWDKPIGSPDGDYWSTTNLSDLDQAKDAIADSLFKSFAYNSAFTVDEFTRTSVATHNNGTFFALQLKQRDAVVNKIKIRTSSTGSLTDFDIKLYIVDRSLKVTNVLSTHNLIVSNKNTYEVSGLNIAIPNGSYLAVGVESGVSLLHAITGATQTYGFYYAQNISNILSLPQGFKLSQAQNFIGGIAGIGVEATGSVLPSKYSDLYKALIVTDFVAYDYLAGIGLNSAGNGEFWTVTKVYPNAVTIDSLTVNLRSLIDTSKTSFKVRPYFIDATTKKVVSVGQIIEFTIQSGVTKYTSSLNLSVPPNAYFSLGVEAGVNIGYNGNASAGSFGYSQNLSTSLNFAVGNNAAPVQTIPGATGFSFIIRTEKFFDYNNYVRLDSVPTKIPTNYLSGKKIVAIGDSKVQGHSLSDAAGQTWFAKLAIRNGMTRVNYGINGTYLSNKQYVSGGNTYEGVVKRYLSMDNDADYVLVFAGTNDAHNSIVPMGTDDSTDDTTFKGALNILCDGLLTKYPNKKIGFITPYFRNSNYPPYIEAIKTICKKYSIPVFDNSENGGVCWTNAAQVSAITLGDTYHLNELGMERASYAYEAFIRSL